MRPEPTTQTSTQTTSWTILALACAAQFMVVLDVSVVNVALPSIATDLGFSATALQWVVNSYALTFAGFLLLGGRLADVYGLKRVFVLGLWLFCASSLVGGLANSPDVLVLARGVQGLGAAVLAPASLTLLTTTYPEGPQRVRALAIWTAVALAGGTAGNVIGGTLTEFLSWHWVLLVNVPVGVVAIPSAIRFLKNQRGRGKQQNLDILGAILATTGLVALTYGATQVPTQGWENWRTLAALGVGVGTLAAFIGVEARLARVPLLPLRLFDIRSISAGNAVMLLAGAAFMPMWYFLSLYMQQTLHYSPLQTGLGFLPHTLVTMLVGMRVAPRLMDHVADRTLVIVGALLAATGFVWQGLVAPGSDYITAILGPGIVFSIGGGLLNTPLTNTVVSGVDAADAGAASGLMNTTKQVGGALGLAVLVAITASTRQLAGTTDSHAFLSIAAVLILVAGASLMLPTERP